MRHMKTWQRVSACEWHYHGVGVVKLGMWGWWGYGDQSQEALVGPFDKAKDARYALMRATKAGAP